MSSSRGEVGHEKITVKFTVYISFLIVYYYLIFTFAFGAIGDFFIANYDCILVLVTIVLFLLSFISNIVISCC